MGVALYPVLEQEISGFDPSLEVSGRALSNHSELIDATCKKLGIKTVWDFYYETPEETQAHLGEELTSELEQTLRAEPLKWSDAAEGLAWAQTLRGQLSQQADDAAQEVVEDLAALERVLSKAVEANLRFRLCLDM